MSASVLQRPITIDTITYSVHVIAAEGMMLIQAS